MKTIKLTLCQPSDKRQRSVIFFATEIIGIVEGYTEGESIVLSSGGHMTDVKESPAAVLEAIEKCFPQ